MGYFVAKLTVSLLVRPYSQIDNPETYHDQATIATLSHTYAASQMKLEDTRRLDPTPLLLTPNGPSHRSNVQECQDAPSTMAHWQESMEAPP